MIKGLDLPPADSENHHQYDGSGNLAETKPVLFATIASWLGGRSNGKVLFHSISKTGLLYSLSQSCPCNTINLTGKCPCEIPRENREKSCSPNRHQAFRDMPVVIPQKKQIEEQAPVTTGSVSEHTPESSSH